MAAAAFRYGHAMVYDVLPMLDENLEEVDIQTDEMINNPNFLANNVIFNRIIRGVTFQTTKVRDPRMVD